MKTHRLGDSYTKEALMERTGGPRGQSGLAEQPRFTTGRPGKLLIDIQAKMQAGKGKGYERWARIFNLQEAAKTLNFLIDNNLTDYDQLAALAGSAGARFDEVSGRIKQLEGRMAEVAQLKTHIIQYSKTREVYAAYKNPGIRRSFEPNTPTRLPSTKQQNKPLMHWEESLSPRCPSCPRNTENCWRKSRRCMNSTRRCGRT